MARKPDQADIDRFIASVRDLSVPEDVARSVYQILYARRLFKPKVITVGDSLYKTFGMDEEELDDAALELAEICRRVPPVPGELSDQVPLRTVGDLAKFIARLARSTGTESGSF